MCWIFDFANSNALTFTIDTTEFTFNLGDFGNSQQEKTIISYGLPSHDRDLDTPIKTLDILLNVDLDIDDTINDGTYGEGILNPIKADIIIEPYISLALKAVNRVIDAHRYTKYSIKRTSPEFEKGEISIIKDMTLAEYKMHLYYILESSNPTLVGAYGGGGRMKMWSSTDAMAIMNNLQDKVQREIPLENKLIVKAWEYLFEEDYRNSIIYAATVLELMIAKTIRKDFEFRSLASHSQIDKFISDVSRRLLCTVILGSLKIGDKNLRENIASVYEIRNALIHGKRKRVSAKEAKDAMYYTEELLELLKNYDNQAHNMHADNS